jgi:hypothetical protein
MILSCRCVLPANPSDATGATNGSGEILFVEKTVPISPGSVHADLNEPKLTSKPSGVTITKAINLATNGIILVQATENGVNKTGILLPVDLVVDANRNGEVEFGIDTTFETTPFRFWINNDQDDVEIDEPVTVTTEDSADQAISTHRDLEDFCRLSLSVGLDPSVLKSGDMKVGLRFATTTAGSPGIRCWPNQSAEGDHTYAENGTAAAAQIAKAVFPTEGDTIMIPTSYWNARSDSVAHLIFEGKSKGQGKLVVTLHDSDAAKLGEGGELHLKLLDVREMFERDRVVNNATDIPDPWVDYTPPPQTWVWDPWDWPFDEDPDAENVTAIFVHGWRMTYAEYLSWAQTSYKRLWHQGFKGKFYSFRWATHSPSIFTYNSSEYRAWLCGPALASWVNSLPHFPDQKRIFAHSMGNVVSGAALRSGMEVERYALCNAAMAAMAYDSNPDLRRSQSGGVLSLIGTDQTPDNDPDPAYRDAFGLEEKLSHGSFPRMFNFGLPDDASLASWTLNNHDFKPQGALGYYYSTSPYNRPTWFTRTVTSRSEAMGYVTKSLTRTAGADLRTSGIVTETQNMNDWSSVGNNHGGFGQEHSAQWMWNNQSTNLFWEKLVDALEIK